MPACNAFCVANAGRQLVIANCWSVPPLASSGAIAIERYLPNPLRDLTG